jgi:hypothetical protein
MLLRAANGRPLRREKLSAPLPDAIVQSSFTAFAGHPLHPRTAFASLRRGTTAAKLVDIYQWKNRVAKLPN